MDKNIANALVQLKAYARIDGAWLGLIWVLSFVCHVMQFSMPMMQLLWLGLAFFSIIFVALRLRLFRDKVLKGFISMRRGYVYCIYTFFYGSLILAIVQYVYLAFIDHGYLINQYIRLMTDPAMKPVIAVYGYSDTEMSLIISSLQNIRPIEYVLQCLSLNICLGIFVGLIISLLMKRNETINFQ